MDVQAKDAGKSEGSVVIAGIGAFALPRKGADVRLMLNHIFFWTLCRGRLT